MCRRTMTGSIHRCKNLARHITTANRIKSNSGFGLLQNILQIRKKIGAGRITYVPGTNPPQQVNLVLFANDVNELYPFVRAVLLQHLPKTRRRRGMY